MATSILEFIKPVLASAFDRIVFPDEIRLLLEHLSTDEPLPADPAAAPIIGEVKATANDTAGGFAELNIDPLGPAIPFELRLVGPAAAPTGFTFDLKPADGLLELPAACRPATVHVDPTGKQTLVEEPAGGRVALTLNGTDPLAIRIEGSVDNPARQGIVALDAANRGVMTVGIDPPAFMLGTQGFGMHLPGGLTVDSSATFGPDPIAHGDGRPVPSEIPAWQGIAIREAELFLPTNTPLIGTGPIPIELDLGMPNGLYGHTEVHIEAEGSRPAFDVSLTWDDPSATSLASTLPTAIELRTSWMLDEATGPPGVGTIEFLGGPPLRVTGRYARKPGSSELEFGLIVEAGGDQGLLTVRGTSTSGKVVVTAAALATAFIADANPPTPNQTEYDGFGATLHSLLVAAAGLSAFLEDGSMVLHAVEIDAGLASAGTKLTLRVDYSVDVLVKAIDLGFMSIGMKEDVPMRLRYRNVRLLVDFAQQSALERFHLSFGEADVDVEDPGGWKIESPGTIKDLFDVLGSRSGHGSQWFEIDLRFALDLGPVKVSGATVRATLGANGAIEPELRGLDASLAMPGLFEGSGKASLGKGQLDLALTAKIVPLNVPVFARLSYVDCGDGVNKLVFALGLDLPGSIPFANTGLGLYGLGGIFGVNAKLPQPGPNDDPILFQLDLDPLDPTPYTCKPGGGIFGLGAVVGTVPDLGFTFSARAVVVIGLPDIAVRASLDGKVLSPRVSMAGTGETPGTGASFVGALSVADDGVTIALRGHYEIPILFTMDVPFGARFPKSGTAWYVRLGSDGQPGRGPGPIQAKILPDFLNVGSWAYLMIEGNGIPSLGGDIMLSPAGFALGFGAGFNAKYGVPLVYLEITASVIIALGTRPFLLAGVGYLGGSLHLGPISIGASAEISFLIAPALHDARVRFQVCGEVDLFFFSLKGCVTIEIGETKSEIPEPADWPLESVALSDHLYTKLADAVAAKNQPALADIPVVWPDAIPMLQFAFGPAKALDPGPFTTKVQWDEASVGDGVVGNERLSYTYKLKSISLTAIDPDTGTETPVTEDLEAAWQTPKTGDMGDPGARELALLTWESIGWTRKLVDGAVNAPHDPIPGVASGCSKQFVASRGWALGALGRRHAPGEAWRLPTEPAPGPFASTFEVRVTVSWWQLPLDDSTLPLMQLQFPIRLAGPSPFDAALEAIGRAFSGAFVLPHVTGLPRDIEPSEFGGVGELPVVVMLTFSQPLLDPLLGLLLPLWPPGFAEQRLEVRLIGPNGPTPFPVQGDEAGIGDTFVRRYAEPGGPYFGVSIEYHAALAPSVLGVQGVTVAASNAASDATNAAKAAAHTAATKKASVTPRPMLLPNTIYRLNVAMTGQGQREGGKQIGSVVDHDDTYWFRTADMPGPALSKGTQYLQNTPSTLALEHYNRYVAAATLLFLRDAFDPVYLQRYILSWMPADKARFWFLDDPVGVQIAVNHFPDLAAVYDHDTLVRVRRTDPTRGNPDPFEEQEFPATNRWQAAVSIFQPASDLRLYELTSLADGCPYPSPGGTLGGRPKLQPLSQYELYLDFPFLDPDGTGLAGGAEIKGIIFSTSRYSGPLDLMADLGFGDGGVVDGGLSGDMPVTKIGVTAGDSTADGAIERTLSALGLGRPATARKARSTGLWSQDGETWALHGILLEAPEPIHRPDTLSLKNFGGRIHVNSLACGGHQFEQVIRSASGDRLLFLTDAPFVPTTELSLGVTLQDVPLEVETQASSKSLTCPVAAVPAFAEDLT